MDRDAGRRGDVETSGVETWCDLETRGCEDVETLNVETRGRGDVHRDVATQRRGDVTT